MKIHLGCGKRDFGSDWLHVDGGEFPHVKFNNITQLPFFNDSADLIYASHVIAYFDREEIIPILTEWKRVLKPGGILRLATPDFDKIARRYINSRKLNVNEYLGMLFGKMQMRDKTIYHRTTYDFTSLAELLVLEIGFTEVRRYDWRTTEHANIDDHSRAHMPHDDEAIKTGYFNHATLMSLNIEATK